MTHILEDLTHKMLPVNPGKKDVTSLGSTHIHIHIPKKANENPLALLELWESNSTFWTSHLERVDPAVRFC